VIRAALRNVLNRPGAAIWGLAALIGASAIGALVSVGLGLALLMFAGGALLLVIGLLWSSLHHLTGESGMTLEEALSLAAPSAEQEQKRAVLRALKDLEFERSVGKISDEDYASLSTHYRNQAKDLIRALDRGLEPARAQMEKLVQKRLTSATGQGEGQGQGQGEGQGTLKKKKKKRPHAPEPQIAHAKPEHEALPESTPNTPNAAATSPEVLLAAEGRVCDACSTHNDFDARFCKGCGALLEDSQ